MDTWADVSLMLYLARGFNSASLLLPPGQDFLHACAIHLLARGEGSMEPITLAPLVDMLEGR